MKKFLENWNRFITEKDNDPWAEYTKAADEEEHDVFKFPKEHEKFARGVDDIKPSPRVQKFDMQDVNFDYLGKLKPSEALTDLATNYLFSIKTGGELPVATILKRLLKSKKEGWDEEWFSWIYKRIPKTMAKVRKHVEGDDEIEEVRTKDGVVRWGDNKRVEWAINPFSDRGAYGELEEDALSGGLADKKDPKDFDRASLIKGIKVEFEHTDSVDVAAEIAMDHLTEDPLYYDKLETIEEGSPEDEERWKALADMGDKEAQRRLDRVNWRREPDAYLSYQHDTQKMYALKNSQSTKERLYWKNYYNENLESSKEKLVKQLRVWFEVNNEETFAAWGDPELDLEEVSDNLYRYSSAPEEEMAEFMDDLENQNMNPSEMLRAYVNLVGGYAVDSYSADDYGFGSADVYYADVGDNDAPTLMWDTDDHSYSFQAYSDLRQAREARGRDSSQEMLTVAADHSGFFTYLFEGDEVPPQYKSMMHKTATKTLENILHMYDTSEDAAQAFIEELREV